MVVKNSTLSSCW